MTDAPKPRGRPRGSRNKPKPIARIPSPPIVFESAVLDATTIPVILHREARVFGDPPLEEQVEWPASWRLPEQGESITLRAGWGGIVSTIDFDLERKIAVIYLR